MNTNTESQSAVEPGHVWPPKLIASSAAAGLGMALLAALTGCVGYVDGGYYGGPVAVPVSEVYFYGGHYERGPDVRVYSHRGYESRAVVRPVVVQPQRGPSQSHRAAAPAGHPSGGGHEGNR